MVGLAALAAGQFRRIRPIAGYLMLGSDAPFVDDGTRVYKTREEREKFDRVARATLLLSRTNFIEIRGSWDERFAEAVKAIDAMIVQNGLRWPSEH